MKEPRYWKQLERHPLSAEYPDLDGETAGRMRESVKKGILHGRKVTLLDDKVLDGWQFYRACIDANSKPAFQPLPKGWTPEEYVEAVNDTRRQESRQTIEARLCRRRQRVAEARQNGESIRAISDAEGVSVATVQRDLENGSGVSGDTPEPLNPKQKTHGENPPATVNGRDGKKYPKKQAKSEKQRTLSEAVDGVVEEDEGQIKDSLGEPVPPGLVTVFEAAATFRGILSQFTEIKSAIKKLSDGRAGQFLHPTDITLALDNARRSIRFAMPYAICPACNGIAKSRKPNCPCKNHGWLPEDNYKVLPTEYRQ